MKEIRPGDLCVVIGGGPNTGAFVTALRKLHGEIFTDVDGHKWLPRDPRATGWVVEGKHLLKCRNRLTGKWKMLKIRPISTEFLQPIRGKGLEDDVTTPREKAIHD